MNIALNPDDLDWLADQANALAEYKRARGAVDVAGRGYSAYDHWLGFIGEMVFGATFGLDWDIDEPGGKHPDYDFKWMGLKVDVKAHRSDAGRNPILNEYQRTKSEAHLFAFVAVDLSRMVGTVIGGCSPKRAARGRLSTSGSSPYRFVQPALLTMDQIRWKLTPDQNDRPKSRYWNNAFWWDYGYSVSQADIDYMRAKPEPYHFILCRDENKAQGRLEP